MATPLGFSVKDRPGTPSTFHSCCRVWSPPACSRFASSRLISATIAVSVDLTVFLTSLGMAKSLRVQQIGKHLCQGLSAKSTAQGLSGDYKRRAKLGRRH